MKEQAIPIQPIKRKEDGQNTTHTPSMNIFDQDKKTDNHATAMAFQAKNEYPAIHKNGEFPLVTTNKQLIKAFSDIRNAFFDGEYNHLFTPRQKKILLRVLIGHSHEKITQDLRLSSVVAMRKTLTKGRKIFQGRILQPRGLQKITSEDPTRTKARARAVLEGRLPAVTFLGNYYSSDFLIRRYDENKKNKENKQRMASGFIKARELLKNNTLTIQQYHQLLTEPKYANLIEKENGNIFITQKNVEVFLATSKLPRRDLKKPTPEHETLRSLSNSTADYQRLLKLAKAQKFPFIKRVNRYYVLPHEVSEYVRSEYNGLIDGDMVLLENNE